RSRQVSSYATDAWTNEVCLHRYHCNYRSLQGEARPRRLWFCVQGCSTPRQYPCCCQDTGQLQL
ncbi:hypothetical protein EE612_004283, partial [Oryza sativa]